MAYRIEYGPPGPVSRDRLPLRLILLTAVFFVLFLFTVKAIWPAGSEKLAQLLLPVRNSTGFRQAAQAFFTDLQSGTPFYESLTAFCQEIIAYADIPAA